jgi:hypothetical protein
MFFRRSSPGASNQIAAWRAARELEAFSDRSLSDIGLSRGQLRRVASLLERSLSGSLVSKISGGALRLSLKRHSRTLPKRAVHCACLRDMPKSFDWAAAEGELWGQAAAEVTLGQIANEQLGEFRRRELIGLIQALFHSTLATITRGRGKAFAQAWEVAARGAIDAALQRNDDPACPLNRLARRT